MSNDASHIERIDSFPDDSGRVLITLTARGQADTETWLSFDPHMDSAQQHTDLGKRVHRLLKYQVRRYLNSLASACEWSACVNGLAHGIAYSGYDVSKLHFRGMLGVVDDRAFARLLAVGSEEARVAGFVTAEEVEQLARYELIDAVLDPRPADVAPGPPLVLQNGL